MTGSLARLRALPVAAALFVSVAGLGAGARAGDGSGTDNPALLRGTFGMGCPVNGTCEPANAVAARTEAALTATDPSQPIAIDASPANCEALIAAGIVVPDCVAPGTAQATVPPATSPVAAPAAAASSLPPLAPLAAPQAVAIDPMQTASFAGSAPPGDDALAADWSFALRGGTSWDGRGQHYAVTLSPRGSVTAHRQSGELRLLGGLELTYTPGDDMAITGADAAFEVDQSLSRDLTLKTALTLGAVQEKVNAVSSASNVETGETTVIGSAEATLEQQLGRAGFALGASVTRQYVGDTILVGGIASSNTYRSYSGFGFTARASYALTPILTGFVEGEASREVFDAESASFGATTDNWTLRGTTGLDGKWESGLQASLYGGYGLSLYDSDLVEDAGGFVIGGSMLYPMIRGGDVTASIDTSFSPTSSVAGATTRIGYSAYLGARYLVNDWLTLRGALGGTWTIFPGSDYSEEGLSANTGLDWAVGPHTAFSADYDLGATWTPSDSGLSHAVTVGVTISR